MKLTFDDLEKEDPDEPFVFDTGDGDPFVFVAPDDIPAETLMDIGNRSIVSNQAALQVLLGDDFERFYQTVVVRHHATIGTLNALVTRYNEHFGIGAPGEGSASPASSNRAARRSKRTSTRKA